MTLRQSPKFKRPSIKLTELSSTSVDVEVVKQTTGMTTIPGAVGRITSPLKLMVSHPMAVTSEGCPAAGDMNYGTVALNITAMQNGGAVTDIGPDDKGALTLPAINTIAGVNDQAVVGTAAPVTPRA